MGRPASGAGMGAVAAMAAALAVAGCGSDSGGSAATPVYGKEGPANVKELDDCLAAQPDDRKLVRSTVNGSLSADITLVGQGAPTGPLVNTVLVENGKIDGVPVAREIATRMEGLGQPGAFKPYLSGAFAVYPAPRAETLGAFQPTVEACLPAVPKGI
ncbi:MAG: hypothetical protein ACKOTA_00370 [Solirubrobacterales bacterium]